MKSNFPSNGDLRTGAGVALALTCIIWAGSVYFLVARLWLTAALVFGANFCLLSVPLWFVRRHLKLYFRVFYPAVACAPLVLFVGLGQLRFDDNFLLFAWNCGRSAALPLVQGYLAPLLALSLLCLLLFRRIVAGLPETLSSRFALSASALAALALLVSPVAMPSYGEGYSAKLLRLPKSGYPLSVPYWLLLAVRVQSSLSLSGGGDDRVRARRASDAAGAGEREIEIFVLGETARFDRWSLNGYRRPTSPRLQAVAGLLNFPDVSAPSYNTLHSTPVYLTSAETLGEAINVQGNKQWLPPPTLGRLMHQAGFATAWFGSLPSVGCAIIDSLSSQFDNCRIAGLYDQTSVDAVHQWLRSHSSGKLFLVVHMAGSHWPYHARYPVDFPALPDAAARPLDDRYDTTIAYTDQVLGSLIQLLESQRCISSLLFVSDHGEHLEDDARGLQYHGLPTEQTIHVPMMVWTSAEYASRYPQSVTALRRHRLSRVGGTDIFPTLLGLAHVECGVRPNSNLASSAYRPRQRRVEGFGAHPVLDYDQRSSWPSHPGDY